MNASSIKGGSKDHSSGVVGGVGESQESKSQSARKIKNMLNDMDDQRRQQFWQKSNNSISGIQGNASFSKRVNEHSFQLSNDAYEALESGADLSDFLKGYGPNSNQMTQNSRARQGSSFEKKTNLFIKIDEEVGSQGGSGTDQPSKDQNLETQKFLDILNEEKKESF